MLIRISMKYLNKKFWSNKTVLITGINGFIAGNLAKQLHHLGAKTIGITNNKIKNKFLTYENVSDKIKIHNINIKDFKKLKTVISKYKVNICIHLAAQVDVNIARDNPHETFETNIRGTYNLLEVLRSHPTIKSIIIASSDKAYGDYPVSKLPYKESYDLRALYPYDVSKASADMIAKSYSSGLFKLPIIITRFANIYGPGQLNFTALIPDCILANEGYRNFVPRGDGKNKRDYLFVNDVCDLYLCLSYHLYHDIKYSGEIFNAGTDKGYTVNEIVKKICLLNDNLSLYKNIQKKFKNNKLKGEIIHQYMTYKKLYKYFKWKPSFNIETGLKITLEWYKKFLKTNYFKDFITKK